MDQRYFLIYGRFYNEECDEGYFLEVDVQYLEKLHELHHDLSFPSERIKIEKVKKLVANLRDKTEYITYMKNLKNTLNQRVVFKKIRRVIRKWFWKTFF